MTYRGVYRDGIVVLEGEVDLRNGVSVHVNPVRGGRGAKTAKKPRTASRRSPSAKASPSRKVKAAKLPGFGIWKDRWPKAMSSADIARELRERVSRRMP